MNSLTGYSEKLTTTQCTYLLSHLIHIDSTLSMNDPETKGKTSELLNKHKHKWLIIKFYLQKRKQYHVCVFIMFQRPKVNNKSYYQLF